MHDTASLKHKIRYSEPRVSSVYDFKFSEPRFGEGVFVRIPDTDEDGDKSWSIRGIRSRVNERTE